MDQNWKYIVMTFEKLIGLLTQQINLQATMEPSKHCPCLEMHFQAERPTDRSEHQRQTTPDSQSDQGIGLSGQSQRSESEDPMANVSYPKTTVSFDASLTDPNRTDPELISKCVNIISQYPWIVPELQRQANESGVVEADILLASYLDQLIQRHSVIRALLAFSPPRARDLETIETSPEPIKLAADMILSNGALFRQLMTKHFQRFQPTPRSFLDNSAEWNNTIEDDDVQARSTLMSPRQRQAIHDAAARLTDSGMGYWRNLIRQRDQSRSDESDDSGVSAGHHQSSNARAGRLHINNATYNVPLIQPHQWHGSLPSLNLTGETSASHRTVHNPASNQTYTVPQVPQVHHVHKVPHEPLNTSYPSFEIPPHGVADSSEPVIGNIEYICHDNALYPRYPFTGLKLSAEYDPRNPDNLDIIKEIFATYDQMQARYLCGGYDENDKGLLTNHILRLVNILKKREASRTAIETYTKLQQVLQLNSEAATRVGEVGVAQGLHRSRSQSPRTPPRHLQARVAALHDPRPRHPASAPLQNVHRRRILQTP